MRLILSWVLIALGMLFACRGLTFLIGAKYAQRQVEKEWRPIVKASARSSLAKMPPGVVARISFPRLREDVYVFDDEDPGNLDKGPVWLRMTRSFRAGGNTVVAGHRDTHFRFLKDVRIGDTFRVDDAQSRHLYQVTGIHIVYPKDRSLLAPVPGKVVTLVTCYPFYAVGRADRRMIIRAEAVGELSAASGID